MYLMRNSHVIKQSIIWIANTEFHDWRRRRSFVLSCRGGGDGRQSSRIF